MANHRSAWMTGILLAGLLPWAIPLAAVGDGAAKRWQFTFLERIREESSDNISCLDEAKTDSSAYLRFKTSLGVLWQPTPSLQLNVKLSNEFRHYLAPKSDPALRRNFGLNEVFVDQLWLRWKKPFSLPLDVTVGRQDMVFGEGFIFFDGTPLDGARSAYFNGLRLDWHLGNNSGMTAFYVNQPRLDRWLPVIHEVPQALVEQTEAAVGLHFSGRLRRTAVEAYLLRKTQRLHAALPDAGVDVLGGRLQHPISARISLTAEGALQGGHRGPAQRRALGGHFHLDQTTGGSGLLPAQITLGGFALSGDDRSTADRFEGWDPVFSRYPKWSDSYVLLLGREDRAAFWSNISSLYGSIAWRLLDPLKLTMQFHFLGAPQRTEATGLWSGAGRVRGRLFIARLNWEASRNLSGRMILETFTPGSFYFAGARAYAWVQFEMLLRL